MVTHGRGMGPSEICTESTVWGREALTQVNRVQCMGCGFVTILCTTVLVGSPPSDSPGRIGFSENRKHNPRRRKQRT